MKQISFFCSSCLFSFFELKLFSVIFLAMSYLSLLGTIERHICFIIAKKKFCHFLYPIILVFLSYIRKKISIKIPLEAQGFVREKKKISGCNSSSYTGGQWKDNKKEIRLKYKTVEIRLDILCIWINQRDLSTEKAA